MAQTLVCRAFLVLQASSLKLLENHIGPCILLAGHSLVARVGVAWETLGPPALLSTLMLSMAMHSSGLWLASSGM